MDEILDAAIAVLAEQGYAQLSTRSVAARAGIRAGNLQYYFAAKRDMVRALLDRYLEIGTERLDARLKVHDATAEQRLRNAVEGILVDQASAEDCVLFRELWALASHDPEVALALGGFYSSYRGRIADALRDVNPAMTTARTRQLAHVVVALLEGFAVIEEPASPPSKGSIRAVSDLVVKMTTDG